MDEIKYYIECRALKVWSNFSCDSDLNVARLECKRLAKQFPKLEWRVFSKNIIYKYEGD